MSMIKSLSHKMLAAMFISGGANNFLHPERVAPRVANAGVSEPRQATVLQGALMLLGGMLLALDIMPKLSALLLAGTLVPTTFIGHPFWKEENPANRANQQIHFFKNIAMFGGLLEVLFE